MREFVKYRLEDFPSEISVVYGNHRFENKPPRLSVIIPTLDACRDGYFPCLMDQLRGQHFQDFEVIIVKGDPRQGRAINTGADRSRGVYLLTLDDDTRIGHADTFGELVKTLDAHPQIGMAGVANLIPENAPWLVKRVMREMPRRRSDMVDEITVSDMAEHPCLIMRKDVFLRVGGENEYLPRGLDPYLRQAFREAGFQVVVIPKVFIHHLPPNTLGKLVKQFFRNGFQAALVNRHYPQWVFELTTEHKDLQLLRVSRCSRARRQFTNFMKKIKMLHLIYCINQSAYILGFLWGMVRAEESASVPAFFRYPARTD